MFFDGRDPSADMMDEMFKLARQELRHIKFQPIAFVVKALGRFKKGQGALRPITVRRNFHPEMKF
jgi:hypothetical protein